MSGELETEDARSTYQLGATTCGCCAYEHDADGEAFDEWLAKQLAAAFAAGAHAAVEAIHFDNGHDPVKNPHGGDAPCAACEFCTGT